MCVYKDLSVSYLREGLVKRLQDKLYKAALGVTGGGLLGELAPGGATGRHGGKERVSQRPPGSESRRQTSMFHGQLRLRFRVEINVSPQPLGKFSIVDVPCKEKREDLASEVFLRCF